MEYDTVGNPIFLPGTNNCDCGLTGGCYKCNPLYYKESKIVETEGTFKNPNMIGKPFRTIIKGRLY